MEQDDKLDEVLAREEERNRQAQVLRELGVEYTHIVKRAVEYEETRMPVWAWDDVLTYPAKLVKLVVVGIIRVAPRVGSRRYYLLADRDATKAALETLAGR